MIKQKEFARRRRQLMRMAGEDSIIVLQAAPPRIRNNDVYYPYRQDSDFLYLTGFREHSGARAAAKSGADDDDVEIPLLLGGLHRHAARSHRAHRYATRATSTVVPRGL